MQAILNAELIGDDGYPRNYGGLREVVKLNAFIAQTADRPPKTIVLVAHPEDALRFLNDTDPDLEGVSRGFYPSVDSFLAVRDRRLETSA